MRFSEFGNTLIIPKKGKSILFLKTKIEAQLHTLKARTTVTDNVIFFKTINIILGTENRDINPILLRIYKEGKIVIDNEGNTIKIRWTVKLDTLYVLALYCSIVATITTSLYLSTKLVVSVSIGIAFFLAFIFMGILLISYKLDDLIYKSVYPNDKV